MQKKSEQNIFPDAVPSPPESVSYKDLVTWARQITDTNNQISRQLFDLYNRHLSDALAHPASWKASRSNRHEFRVDNDNDTVVQLNPSVENPLYVVTGETRQVNQPKGYVLYWESDRVNVDITLGGLGGLDTGAGTQEADTVYYIYGIYENTTNKLGAIGSKNPPSIGPIGYQYGEWHYQGAVATKKTSATFPKLTSSCGVLITQPEIERITLSGASSGSLTFNGIPVTAKFVYLKIFVTSLLGSVLAINGESLIQTCFANAHKNWNGPVFVRIANVSDLSYNFGGGDAAVYLNGWIEDPTEWS